MPWEDDEDSGSDPEIEQKRETRAEKEPSPEPKKRGRRRRAGDDDEEEKGGDAGESTAQPISRKVSGWGEDDGGGFVRKAVGGGRGSDGMDYSATKESGTAGKRKGRNRHFDDDGADDIMIIPDLDEDMGDDADDITLQVAAAPKNINRRVASLHELDSDLKYSVSSAENGIDLSLLTTNLVPPGKCLEVDEVWDFGGLLQSVTQEFHKERELDLDNEGAGGEGSVGGGASGSDGAAERKFAQAADLDGGKDLKEEDARKMDEVLGTGGGGKVRKESGRRRRNA
ncbi:hypothetical protein TrCOL_g738 [Triparma columacea]|uniref:Uncharacterized protein n=1 Tax=Triparma columacea TaxID=722753 RepID=A0A9W7G2W6_9STRA|nr:hypothetical protein TrCOL_g738 [Triparma columacea]